MQSSILKRLVAPLDADRFLEDHFGKRPVHLTGTTPRIDGLSDLERLLSHASEIDAARVDGSDNQRQLRIDPAQIAPLYACGFTICASVSHDPVVSAALTDLAFELGLAGAPFAKLYSSPDHGGFALHFDSFHVFVVQLSGAKRWRFGRSPAVEAPLTGGKLDASGQPVWSGAGPNERIVNDAGQPVNAPDVAAFEEVELAPGDCLYLPPGVWHVARARGHSVALSLSPPRTPVSALFCRVLEDHLKRSAAWRRDAFTPTPFDGTGRIPRPLAELFDGALATLRAALDSLDARAIHRLWALNVPQPQAPAPKGRDPRPIAPDDAFVHLGTGLARYLVAPEPAGSDAIYFHSGGAELSLPIDALGFVARLAKTDRFTAREACAWDPSLSFNDVGDILQQLIDADLLERLG